MLVYLKLEVTKTPYKHIHLGHATLRKSGHKKL